MTSQDTKPTLRDTELQIQTRKLEDALKKLESQTSCGHDCNQEEKCKISGLCLTAADDAYLATLRGLGTLGKIERESGAIPKQYADTYLNNADRIIRRFSKLSKGTNRVTNYITEISSRKTILRGLRTF